MSIVMLQVIALIVRLSWLNHLMAVLMDYLRLAAILLLLLHRHSHISTIVVVITVFMVLMLSLLVFPVFVNVQISG